MNDQDVRQQLNQIPLEELVEKAHAEISALCHGKNWRMCIPVQAEDSDILLGEALMAQSREIKRLNTEGGKCVKIWGFCDAPKEYRDLSGHGGDEDWIVFIPSGSNIWPIADLFEDDSYVYGWGHVFRRQVEGGEIIIFAHA